MTVRWLARIIGIIMLLVFLLMLASLQKRLVQLQNRAPVKTTTTSTPGQP